MTISFSTAKQIPDDAKFLVHAAVEDDLTALAETHPAIDADALAALDFSGKAGQSQVVSALDGRVVAVVGLGKADDLDPSAVRKAGAVVAGLAAKHTHLASTIVSDVDGTVDRAAAAQAFAEGIVLGAYEFLPFKSEPEPAELAKVTLVGSTAAAVGAAADTGATIAAGVCLARDFVNEPGGSLTPPVFADRVAEMAAEKGLIVEVMDLDAIRDARLGGLLGVNRGSDNPARFVTLTYEPDEPARKTLALVGKGITFDAGGLSIKSGQGMTTMKSDKGGASAVIGAMAAIADLAPEARVKAYLPMTDNMLGGDATRPGDVLTIRNGKTIEVLNTDAEGRLILADALSLASEDEPDAIVDLATLTGACMVALGTGIAGLMGTDDDLIAQVEGAAETTGERVWHLPLPADYRKLVDSPVADMKNIGGSYAGALTAGLILKEFVADGIAWAHLDIAGPSFVDSADGENKAGGTGYGVRLLVELARRF